MLANRQQLSARHERYRQTYLGDLAGPVRAEQVRLQLLLVDQATVAAEEQLRPELESRLRWLLLPFTLLLACLLTYSFSWPELGPLSLLLALLTAMALLTENYLVLSQVVPHVEAWLATQGGRLWQLAVGLTAGWPGPRGQALLGGLLAAAAGYDLHRRLKKTKKNAATT